MSVAWGKKDLANNSPKYAVSQVDRQLTTANVNQLWSNTTSLVYKTRGPVGVFGVDRGELANAVANGKAVPAHTGWALRTEGRGGRAGRVHYETLVAMKSMTAGNNANLFINNI